MAISLTTGIISGLDTGKIIEQLVAVESGPLVLAELDKATYQTKISAYGTLSSQLSTLKATLSSLKATSIFSIAASSSNESVLTATTTSSASDGSHTIDITNLATAHSIYSEIFTSEDDAVADLSTVSTQKLKIQVGSGTAVEITVDSTNNTLKGIRDAINSANAGASGFVINSSNNTLIFNDGVNRTATLTTGTYTGTELAAEMKAALESANGSVDTYTVTYDAATKKFTVTNDTGNTNALDLLFEDSGTTAEQVLGFTSTDHASIAVGGSITSDNATNDNSNVGALASIVNVGTGFRLVLTSDTTGVSNTITVQVDEDNDGVFEEATAETDTSDLSRLAFNAPASITNMTQSQAAEDASLVVDGLTITRSTNTITDVITGVTLTLLDDDSSKNPVTLTLSKNLSEITGNVNSFVSAYNAAIGSARSLSVPVDGQSVVLAGDSTARGIITSLRTTITTSFAGNIPVNFGLRHDKDGVLSLDTSTLDDAINSDLQSVLDLFDAMAKSLEDTLGDSINTLIPARTDGLNSSIDRTEGRIDRLERRLERLEVDLTKEFTLLEQTLAQIQADGDFLTQQLAALSKISSITSRRNR